jgi:hypothetical protein
MTTKKIKIILFEDTEKTRTLILKAFSSYLGRKGEVIPFTKEYVKELDEDKEKMYEYRLENILSKPPYMGATLIVADRDLSMSVDSDFRGLSVNAVVSASRKLAIPICSYARQQQQNDYDWRGRWEEGQIILQFTGDENDLARQAIIDAEGFLYIMTHLHAAIKKRTNNSLSMILATILGKPEYHQKIELYGVGDQNRLLEILKKEYPKNQRDKMMAHFLGYWLWDSLLRYPGLFVNEIASASYLNIDTKDFQKPEIKDIFKSALYKGPFSDPNKPYWWRGILDDIVSHNGYTDGLDLVNKKFGFTVERSYCSIDITKQAGYYCIISGQPVSFENSRGGLSWFPRGADLTRISNPKYEEYSPWIGS